MTNVLLDMRRTREDRARGVEPTPTLLENHKFFIFYRNRLLTPTPGKSWTPGSVHIWSVLGPKLYTKVISMRHYQAKSLNVGF